MSNQQHTPGNWYATKWTCHAKTTVVVDDTVISGKYVVAECETEADALLVSAAKELLTALVEARRELHACQAVIHLAGGFDPAYVSEAQAAIKRADAAIAKATT